MIKNLLIILLLFCVKIPYSYGALNLDILSTEISKTKVLFINSSFQDDRYSKNIFYHIKKNLLTTDLITTLISSEADLNIDSVPNFKKFKNSDVDILVVLDVKRDYQDLNIKFRVWDLKDRIHIVGKHYIIDAKEYKKIANLISNELFKSILKENKGHFDSQILYVSESGSVFNRKKRISIMDYDSGNKRYLTDGGQLVLTPVFHKKGNVLYLKYANDIPQIYSLDIENNFSRKLINFRGTTFSPSVNPINRNIIVFSAIENGNTNIFKFNTLTNSLIKLTNTKSIDTTPSYSPDGEFIAFSSNRLGKQDIYIMKKDGTELRRITRGKRGSYSKPIWSPDGSLIAFTKMNKNKFFIGTMTPYGSNEKILTSGYLVEGAKWGPNSRYLIYSKSNSPYGEGSVPKLYIIDVVTLYNRKISTQNNEGATDPDWFSSES